MRIKFGLTNDALEQEAEQAVLQSRDPADFREAYAPKILAKLFPVDPLVRCDDGGWYLSASAMDAADEVDSGHLWDEADKILKHINGVSYLLRTAFDSGSMRFTERREGVSSPPGLRIYYMSAYVTSLDDLDPESATNLLSLAETDHEVARLLELLGLLKNGDTFWFIAYLAMDLMRHYGSDNDAFRDWITSRPGLNPDLFYDFLHSANYPGLGAGRRHAGRAHVHRFNKSAGRPAQQLNTKEAHRYLRKVALAWLADTHGVDPVRQGTN